MSIPWATILGTASAVFSAVAAGGALLTAGRANRTAETVAAIERDRWNLDLTPDLGITFERRSDTHALLKVELKGPAGLDRLDETVITVRDESGIDHLGHAGLGGSRPVEELQRVVWSLYRFSPHANGTDPLGREMAPFPLQRGEWRPFSMEHTLMPSWFSDMDSWQRRYAGKPLLLRFECRRGEHSWVIPYAVPAADLQPAVGGGVTPV